MDLYEKYRLTRVINACGKMTHLAGAIVLPDVIEEVTHAMGCFYDLDELQDRAGEVIARATGAQWGCVTACTAAGISLGVAAAMTGNDLGRVWQLPDTTGMADEVIIQKGHAVNFGAPGDADDPAGRRRCSGGGDGAPFDRGAPAGTPLETGPPPWYSWCRTTPSGTAPCL